MRKKRRKTIKTQNSWQFYIAIFISIIFITILLFNDFGLLTYFKLKKQHDQLDQELQALLVHQNTLQFEINKLQTDQNYIEQIAREKFMMVKPGERVYRVKETKEIVK